MTTTAVSGAFTIAPFIVSPTTPIDLGIGARWVMDEPGEAWWLPIGGVATLLIEVHLINLLSVLHARWAKLMLGSRAPHIVAGAPIGEPPGGPEGGLPPPSVVPYRPSALPTSFQAQPGDASAEALASLTSREIEVLRLIARGYSNAEIAETFVVSEGTVETHVKRILAKLDRRDRTQVVVWAYEHRVVEPVAPAA